MSRMPIGRMFLSSIQTIGQEETRNGLTEHNRETLDSLQMAEVLLFTSDVMQGGLGSTAYQLHKATKRKSLLN